MSRVKMHDWLAERSMTTPSLVLRIDDYSTTPLNRGQFVPHGSRYDDALKAIWPTHDLAQHAAEWAVQKFGHQYAVFKMVEIYEQAVAPIKITKVTL